MPEFNTDGNLPSYLTWDIIPMKTTYLTAQPGVQSQTLCQAACSNNAACQYYAWYNYTGAVVPTSADQCYLRIGPQAVVPVDLLSASNVVNAVGFEVRAFSQLSSFTCSYT